MERVKAGIALLGSVLVATAAMLRAEDIAVPQEKGKGPPEIVLVNPPLSERILIDGSKNPEMIAQWDVWKRAFLMIDRTSDAPTVVWNASSKDEIARIVAAAKQNASSERDCVERMNKLAETVKTDEARFINERTHELNVDCRSETLRIRDHLLDDLSPGSRAALTQFIESLKAGMRVYVQKGEMALYRQPQ